MLNDALNLGNPEFPLDPNLFNVLVVTLNTTMNEDERNRSNQALCAFIEREDAFKIFFPVMEAGFGINTKLVALVIMKKFVISNWNSIDSQMQANIKEFIFNLLNNYILAESSDVLINKVDEIIVEIVKYEWPHQWPNLLQDLYAEREKIGYIKNAFVITTMIITEITDYNSSTLTSSRIAEMQDQFKSESEPIFQLISGVLDMDTTPPVKLAVIDLFQILFNIFSTPDLVQNQLFEKLCVAYMPDPTYTVKVISLLSSIQANYVLDQTHFIDNIFNIMIQSLQPWFPDGQISSDAKIEDLTTIFYSLTHFINSFSPELEQNDTQAAYITALGWTMSAFESSIPELSRLCTEMWYNISSRLYNEAVVQKLQIPDFYAEALKHIRRQMIFSMESPNDIILNVDENGIHIRAQICSENMSAYYTAKDLMIFLANLDLEDMSIVINEALEFVNSSDEFNFQAFESLCWSIGSIRGTFPSQEETVLISRIIILLLQLIESRQEIEIRAAVAAGLMYICSQYTRFLRDFPEILLSVMNKLVEFTQLGNEALQDASIKALLTIVDNDECYKVLCRPIAEHEESFLQQVIDNFSQILENLTESNTIEMFDIVASIVNGLTNEAELEHYLEILINQPLEVIMNFTPNPNFEGFDAVIQCLMCVDKIAVKFGTTILPYMERLMPAIVNIYTVYGKYGSDTANEYQSETQISENCVRIKNAILSLIEGPTRTLPNLDRIWLMIGPPIFDVFCQEYFNCHFLARTSKLVNLLAVVCLKYRDQVINYIPQVFEQVFIPTYRMVVDLDNSKLDFSPFRTAINVFLRNIVNTGFIYNIQPDLTNICVEFLKSNALCLNQDVSELAIRILGEVFASAEYKMNKQTASDFQNAFGPDLLVFAFQMLTDSVHKFEFMALMEFLRRVLTSNVVKERLIDCIEELLKIFKKITTRDLFNEIQKLASLSNDYMRFKAELRSFLISEKQFSPRDPCLVQPEIEALKKENEENLRNVNGLENHPVISEEQQRKFSELAMFINGFSLH